ncbi:XdhC family protein [Nocardia huaxiensis]|uniref:XdhC family protein n=1 Tax=Nocardia huaxiensis TaxID=2755382 RepID=UPI001E63F057|nr:XdhC/CoxI family protein [Nocardia huaxiensis]UFS96710.1 XdhC family protein [Nocardia huaxiensis]
MRDVLPQLIERVRQGPVVLARIIAVTGAGPREVGAAMIITGAGEVIGSLSGGCVEAAVTESAVHVLDTGEAVLERFGIADPDGLAIGLTCGGEMEVFLECVDTTRLPLLEALDHDIRAGVAAAVATTLHSAPDWHLIRSGAAIDGADLAAAQALPGRAADVAAAPPVVSAPGGVRAADRVADGAEHAATNRTDRSVTGDEESGVADAGESVVVGGAGGVSRDALNLARAGRTGTVGTEECMPTAFPPRAFVQSFGPPARMILAGANDFVRALSRLGAQLGYRVTVVDARETFTTAARFPAAHEVVVDWPHRYLRREHEHGRIDARTVVVVLTHDSKFDVPMLATALAMEELAFVGALGSRRTHTDRLERLTAAGVGPEQLRRLRSPVGLDLNASTPDETAVSIAAQIIAEAGGASGRPLAATDGPIHR